MSDAAVPDRDQRLLVVDDQAVIRRALAMMLAAEPGIDVVGQAADAYTHSRIELAVRAIGRRG